MKARKITELERKHGAEYVGNRCLTDGEADDLRSLNFVAVGDKWITDGFAEYMVFVRMAGI